jgi:hypothetical protein
MEPGASPTSTVLPRLKSGAGGVESLSTAQLLCTRVKTCRSPRILIKILSATTITLRASGCCENRSTPINIVPELRGTSFKLSTTTAAPGRPVRSPSLVSSAPPSCPTCEILRLPPPVPSLDLSKSRWPTNTSSPSTSSPAPPCANIYRILLTNLSQATRPHLRNLHRARRRRYAYKSRGEGAGTGYGGDCGGV